MLTCEWCWEPFDPTESDAEANTLYCCGVCEWLDEEGIAQQEMEDEYADEDSDLEV
jgi:hypothetical protein